MSPSFLRALPSAFSLVAALGAFPGAGRAVESPTLLDLNVLSASSSPGPFESNGNGLLFFPAYDGGPEGRELWVSDGSAGGTRLVKDIFPGPESSHPLPLKAVGGRVLFSANDGAHGRELWASDGTSEGTVLLADAEAGAGDGVVSPLYIRAGERFYFWAAAELWVSDGTAAGTRRVSSVQPGSSTSPAAHLTAASERIFFVGSEPDRPEIGGELWTSDGTEAGTIALSDFLSANALLDELELAEGLLYFAADDRGETGRELWVSDGTRAGTHRVSDLRPGPRGSGAMPLGAVGASVVFSADDGERGVELWVSDGSGDGTRLLLDIAAGGGSSHPTPVASISGGRVIFSADDRSHGEELWASDGTEAGTMLLRDFAPGPGSSFLLRFEKVGDRLLFVQQTADGARALWTTNGTSDGTLLLADLSVAPSNGWPAMENANGRLFLVSGASTATVPAEIWTSNGSPLGTLSVLSVGAGSPVRSIDGALGSLGGKLFFAAETAEQGKELWVSDGTRAGTQMLLDLNRTGTRGSTPRSLRVFDGRVYFTADDGLRGQELWASDGTPGGTELVRDLNEGSAGSSPVPIAALSRHLILQVHDDGSDFGPRLWATDGTAPGTEPLNAESAIEPDPQSPTQVGDLLYFLSTTRAQGRELWVTDGASRGTWLVRDLVVGQASSGADDLRAVGPWLFFALPLAGGGKEWWISDSTLNGTRPLRAAIALTEIWDILDVAWALDRAFFAVAVSDVGGSREVELWASDLSPAGTQLLGRFRPSPLPQGSALQFLGASAAQLFFAADDGEHGRELWRSDGTPAGTRIVRDVEAGPTLSVVDNAADLGEHAAAVLGERLIYPAFDREHGVELWSSDGSEAGTLRIADAAPGPGSSWPVVLLALDSRVFFSTTGSAGYTRLWTTDGSADGSVELVIGLRRDPLPVGFDGRVWFIREFAGSQGLWSSDGTPAGTRAEVDLSGACGGLDALIQPGGFVAGDCHLFYVADDCVHGAELFAIPTAGPCESGVTAVGPFRRGDCNGDGAVQGTADAIALLLANFVGGAELRCLAACDANADGDTQGVSDAIILLIHNFIGGLEIPAPFPGCGSSTDGEDRHLGCEEAPASCRG